MLRGPYRLQPLATTSNDERENLRYAIPHQGQEIWPEKQWQWEKSRTFAALANDELVIAQQTEGEWSVNYKQYLRDEDDVVQRGAKPPFLKSYLYLRSRYGGKLELLAGEYLFVRGRQIFSLFRSHLD